MKVIILIHLSLKSAIKNFDELKINNSKKTFNFG